jgi:hypothetical protein
MGKMNPIVAVRPAIRSPVSLSLSLSESMQRLKLALRISLGHHHSSILPLAAAAENGAGPAAAAARTALRKQHTAKIGVTRMPSAPHDCSDENRKCIV